MFTLWIWACSLNAVIILLTFLIISHHGQIAAMSYMIQFYSLRWRESHCDCEIVSEYGNYPYPTETLRYVWILQSFHFSSSLISFLHERYQIQKLKTPQWLQLCVSNAYGGERWLQDYVRWRSPPLKQAGLGPAVWRKYYSKILASLFWFEAHF